jgi:hypothetical protein
MTDDGRHVLLLGLAVAQHNLACNLLLEKKEIWKALEYWKMAADQNFSFALVNNHQENMNSPL